MQIAVEKYSNLTSDNFFYSRDSSFSRAEWKLALNSDGVSSSVVHSQHHCIVRVIKLLNKFNLSRLLSLWNAWKQGAQMKICSDTRGGKFFQLFRQLQKNFYCHLANFIFPRRELKRDIQLTLWSEWRCFFDLCLAISAE